MIDDNFIEILKELEKFVKDLEKKGKYDLKGFRFRLIHESDQITIRK